MKIIQVISSLGNGGAEKFVVELTNELSLNNQLFLVSLKDIEDWMFPPKYLNESVPLITLGKKKGYDLKVLVKLIKLLRKEKPNIVHIHLNMPIYYFLPIIPVFRNIKFVFTIHSAFEPHKNFFVKLNKLPFYKRVTNICLTNNIYDKFCENFPKLNFYKIENGIKQTETIKKEEINELIKAKDEYTKIFLFVGRLSYAKNIPLLLDVLGDESLSDIKLLIIGKGENVLKAEVVEYSRRTKNRIQYLGKKGNVLEYMKMADALIITSRHEGLPVVILEALSVGLPIISTPVGGIPDVLTQMRNGILSAGIERKDMLMAINEFISLDENSVSQIKSNNIKDFKDKYSIQICASSHLNLYAKSIK